MSIKQLLLICFSCFFLFGFSQKKTWFDKDFRNSKWPKLEYYSHYDIYPLDELGDKNATNLEREAYAEELIKEILSEKIVVAVTVKSQSVAETTGASYSNIFRKTSQSETSITFPGLQIKKQKKGKSLHIFIYVKKDELQDFATARFGTWVDRLNAELVACRALKNEGAYQAALEKANQINSDKQVVDQLSTLLEAMKTEIHRQAYNNLNAEISYLMGALKERVDPEEQYYNQKIAAQGIIGNTVEKLEEKKNLLEQCKKIAPDLAIQDGLNEILIMTNNQLFNLYCLEAVRSEEANQWSDAIELYEKAKDIDARKKIEELNITPFRKILECKKAYNKHLTELGDQEYRAKNFLEAKAFFIEAKAVIQTLQNNTRLLIKINRDINRCNKKLGVSKAEKAKDNDVDFNSPNRFMLRPSAGTSSNLTSYNLDFDKTGIPPKAFSLSGMLGYRFNLPDEKIILDNGTMDRSKGNVFGVFVQKGNDYFDENQSRSFWELEAGLVWYEFFRLSFGAGYLQIDDISDISFNNIDYYIGTCGVSLHLGQLFIEPSISYLYHQQIEMEDKIRLNLSAGIRLLLF